MASHLQCSAIAEFDIMLLFNLIYLYLLLLHDLG